MNQSLTATVPSSHLLEKIKNKTAQVGIIGLGYVGLPLISAFTNAGFRCIGYDVDQKKVEELSAGRSYIKHVASTTVASWIEKDLLEPTTEMERLDEADILIICVPTPLTDSRDPDLKYVESTVQAIAAVLRAGQLVVLESTTYPTQLATFWCRFLNRTSITSSAETTILSRTALNEKIPVTRISLLQAFPRLWADTTP